MENEYKIVGDPDDVVILHNEILEDMRKLINNMMKNAYIDQKGTPRAPCEQILFQLSTRPKTLQRKGRQSRNIEKYRANLRKKLEEHKETLDLIKDKEMLLFIIAYLTEKNFNNYDVDNIPKHFCDVLKEFTSSNGQGDNMIRTLIVQKKIVKQKPPEAISLEQCEEFLVFITHDSYKKFLFD
jgi:Holliday junction resolvase RusA-like endonuclease